MAPKLSIIITAKDREDQKLKDLLYSIEQQTFIDYEVLVITEGDSESAKGIGIKQAKGEIICILASDNLLNDERLFEYAMDYFEFTDLDFAYPWLYYYDKYDNILNRYFALFGVNDPIPLYLNKNDKLQYYPTRVKKYTGFRTFGDNGFFIRKETILKSDMEHYFHIDNIYDVWLKGYTKSAFIMTSIWHRTGGNIFKFFMKRYKYADKFAVKERRWHMIERRDIPRVLWFIFCTVTLIQPLYLACKGFRYRHDMAWFLHPIVCWFTLITYTIWITKRALLSVLIRDHKS